MKKFLALFGSLVTSAGLLLVLATLSMVVVVTLNRKPPLSAAPTLEATLSPVSQTATAVQTATSSPAPTITPAPTTTSIPPGVTVDWIPTPIRVEALPTPLPGKGHITGRALCGSASRPFQSVYLIWIEGETYAILLGIDADEAGRWFFGNIHPGTYAVLGDHPKSMPTQVFTVTADQITDLGDVSLPPSDCE